MNIGIKELQQDLFIDMSKMITELMNYHRILTSAPKEFWVSDEESVETLKECDVDVSEFKFKKY